MKITCQHCAVHHLFTSEEILAVAKAINAQACERIGLDAESSWRLVEAMSTNCYLDYAVAALTQIARMLPERPAPERPIGVSEIFKSRCYNGGKQHRFAPRYDEREREKIGRCEYTDTAGFRALITLNVYLGDVCEWCGAVVNARGAK